MRAATGCVFEKVPGHSFKAHEGTRSALGGSRSPRLAQPLAEIILEEPRHSLSRVQRGCDKAKMSRDQGLQSSGKPRSLLALAALRRVGVCIQIKAVQLGPVDSWGQIILCVLAGGGGRGLFYLV